MPYLAYRYHPLKPFHMYSRCAKKDPPTSAEHAVYYMWRDPLTVED